MVALGIEGKGEETYLKDIKDRTPSMIGYVGEREQPGLGGWTEQKLIQRKEEMLSQRGLWDSQREMSTRKMDGVPF